MPKKEPTKQAASKPSKKELQEAIDELEKQPLCVSVASRLQALRDQLAEA